MIRTQVQLTGEQMRKLRRAARDQGVSIAEIVRRCVDHGIDDELANREERYATVAELIGAFRDRDEGADVSEEHNRYLDKAFD